MFRIHLLRNIIYTKQIVLIIAAICIVAITITGCSNSKSAKGEPEPTQDEVAKQITSWFNRTTVDFFGQKLSPTTAADLVKVKVKERKGNDTEVTVVCDLVFRMKATYERGRDKTPMCLLVDLGFEKSPTRAGDLKTLEARFSFEKINGAWQLQEYRRIVREDHLICGADVAAMSFSFGGPPEGELVSFGCLDKNGKTIKLELASKKLTGGMIETRQFGVIRMKSSGVTGADYYMTESQIRKIKKSLGY